MGAMFGRWDPATAASVENAVDLIADEMWRALHPDRNPTRHEATSLKWRRADAVVEIARRVLDGRLAANAAADTDGEADGEGESVGSGRAKRGRHAQALVSVVVDHRTLAGERPINGICELFDGTPLAPDTARRLACDAAIVPMILGPNGEVLNQGRRIYLPTMPQRHALWIRDRHCRFPGCRRPAKWTNAHHIVAFPNGPTDLDNLLLLCDKHHHLIHEGQWQLAGNAFDFTVYRPDGTLFDHITRGPP